MTARTTINPPQQEEAPSLSLPKHPILVVGAGPCGLVVAATLQKRKIPFVIVEKASRSKICSNAGSGFELAPTAVRILTEGLGIDVSEIMSTYEGMTFMTIEGKTLRKEVFPEAYIGGSVNRAEMQQYLLNMLFPSPEDEEGILVCGSGIESYDEFLDEKNIQNSKVVAKLESGQQITGCALLACDGIRSKCRAVMYQTANDPLHYCKAICYWGKTPAPKGSPLREEFLKTQFITNPDGTKSHRTCFLVGAATRKIPAVFFAVPSQGGAVLLWGITVASKTPPGDSNSGDLTRRGGGVLTESDKADLLSASSKRSVLKGLSNFPFLKMLVEQTPAKDITQAGFYDRKNLSLSYTSESKLVALLGDAAHPQTPYLGQGVNMAITDAYVYASVLADALQSGNRSIPEAMTVCDPDSRRKANKKSVRAARLICDLSNSSNPIVCWLLKLVYKHISTKEFMNQIANTDYSNREYWEYFQSLSTITKTA